MEIKTGNPTKLGTYLGYVDLPFDSKFMEKKLLFWQNGEWWYFGSDQKFRGHVNCWIGPFPSPTLDDINSPEHVKFAICTYEGFKNNAYLAGPFNTLSEASENYGNEGEYVIRITKNKAVPVLRWDESKPGWRKKKKG